METMRYRGYVIYPLYWYEGEGYDVWKDGKKTGWGATLSMALLAIDYACGEEI
jgi:hypothetical protein